MSKTKLEIIEETVEYIKENGRALGSYENPYNHEFKEDACVYKAKSGIGCAVGRIMKDEAYSTDLEGLTVDDFVENGSIDHLIEEEYHGHDIYFWQDLQAFHDTGTYWTDDYQLTRKGKIRLTELKEDYNENR